MDQENYIYAVLQAQERQNHHEIRQLILEQERMTLKPTDGSGQSPSVRLNNQTWADFLIAKTRTVNKPITVLDLGAGDDAKMWTADLSDPQLDHSAKIIRTSDVIRMLYVVAHSGQNPSIDVYQNGVISEFIAGHFVDILQTLINNGTRFDLILSKAAIHQSAFALDILKMIDQLLNAGGAAFLDKVGGGKGDRHTVIYKSNMILPASLTKENIWQGLSYKEAQIAGLRWTHGIESVAWKKGQFREDKMPTFKGVNFLGNEYSNHGYFDFFRFIYTCKR
jgi:hypothetical protein